VLLDAAGRRGLEYLRQSDGHKLPYALLDELDEVWSAFSGGTFGFHAQLSLYPGPAEGVPAGSAGDFFALAASLGWRQTPRDTPTRYERFIAAHPPPGFFPTLRHPPSETGAAWNDKWQRTVMAVHLRLRGRAKTR
jgi:hypothetical protein